MTSSAVRSASARPARWARVLPRAWAVLLPLLLLGPALRPGYLLTYDMVWVPDLALRPDFLGFGTALPRAVPSDAVVAVLDNAVPAQLLEKVALLVPLVLAGGTLVGGTAAVSVFVWNPFVAERLALGHWTVLLGYAVLPWLVLSGARWRRGEPVGWLPWVLLPLGCLSAGAGLASALTLLVSGTARHFLVYSNYDALLEYNCAHSYAISVALLGDAIASNKALPGAPKPPKPRKPAHR